MIKRLRKKFILISIATVTSVMILLCAGVNVVNYISVTARLDSTINTICLNNGRIPMPGSKEFHDNEKDEEIDNEDDDEDEIREDIPRNRRFEKEMPFQTRYFVINYDSSGAVKDYNLERIAAVEAGDTARFASVALKNGEGFGYESGYRFKVEKKTDGTYSAVFLDCNREMTSVKNLFVVSVLVNVFCIALICAIIIILSGRAMEPVIQNDLKQKQFITDAGHELKTPITVINTCLSVLEMEVGKQKWIDKASAQTEKLKNLVNSLVTLAKSDEGRELKAADFNISDAVNETVESFSDAADSNGHPIIADIEKEIHFSGDEYSVRQLVSILIDNALKYSSEGSEINFSLQKHKKGVLLKSSNKCDNIDDEELPKLFDRFYRADKARSSEGGFGIGLSVARGICENHKGYIKASRVNNNQIEFTAQLNSIG